MKVRLSLKYVLVVKFLLVSAVPILAIGCLSFYFLYKDLQSDIFAVNRELARSLAAELETDLREPFTVLTHIREKLDEEGAGASATVTALLNHDVDSYTYLENLFLVDRSGKVVNAAVSGAFPRTVQHLIGKDLTREDIYRETSRMHTHRWSASFPSVDSGEIVTTLMLPYRYGMVAATINLHRLNRSMHRGVTGFLSSVVLLSRDGKVVSHKDLSLTGKPFNLGLKAIPDSMRKGGSGEFVTTIGGKKTIVSYVPLQDPAWVLCVQRDYDHAFAPVRRLETIFIAGMLSTVVLALAMAFWCAGGILAPIASLLRNVKEIASGNYGFVAHEQGYAELAELEERFQGMATAVQVRQSSLQQKNEELSVAEEELRQQLDEYQRAQMDLHQANEALEAIFKASPLAIISCSLDGNVVMWNPAAARMFGWSLDREPHCPTAFLSAEGADEFWALRDIILKEKTVNGLELIRKTEDGSLIHISLSAAPLHDSRGAVTGIMSVCADVSERKWALNSLRHRVELEKLIASISALFINLKSEEIDHEISNSIGLIGEFADVDRCFIFSFNEDYTIARETHEWCAPGVESRFETLREVAIEKYAWAMEKLKRFEVVYIPRLSELPDTAFSERELLAELGVISFLSVPMIFNNKLIGMFGFDYAQTEGIWEEDDIALLRMAGEVFVNALEHKRAEEEIRQLNAELEKRVAERTAQLMDTNRELESFSYSVSHDLRAPLRHIEGFSLALLEDCGDEISFTCKDYLRRIRTASQRMTQLINDLLTLSRVSRGALDLRPVDLSAMVQAIADELRHVDYSRHAEFRISAGIVAFGDGQLLRVALENLLRNAWKYTGKTEHPVIEFGSVEECGAPAFYVRDNGAGFDMEYAGRLFNAFQRLHGSEFEGTGIGLATVQRIIHRHGGRVWGHGEVGKGATFYFTLPLVSTA